MKYKRVSNNCNKMLGVLFILMLLPMAIAEEESATDPNTFDQNNPQSFDYANGDYSTINDWSKVEWTNIPADRIPEVPSDQMDFSKLDASQKNAVTIEQLTYGDFSESNLHKAGDLTKYKNSIQAINQKFDIVVTSLGNNPENGAVLDENGFLVANTIVEGEVSSLGSAPITKLSPGTKVTIDDEGNIIVEGEAEPPQEGYYTAAYPLDKDSHIKLGNREEIAIRGQLLVSGVNFFVEKGAIIDGILIQPKATVQLFLDGEEHQDAGSYVSIGRNSLFIGSDKNTDTVTQLRFTKDNSFFEVNPEDLLSFSAIRGTKIEIQKRENLISLVKYTPSGAQSPSENSGAIFNGKNSFLIKKDGEILSSPGRSQGSVPFSLILQDHQGNNLLGTEEEPIKIVFDNSHNFAMIPETLPAEETECSECVLDLSKSQVLQNYVKGEILQIKGLKDKDKLLNENPAVLSRVLQGLKQLTPEAIKSLNGGISVVPDDKINSACGVSGEIQACRIRSTGEIIVKEGVLPDTFIHEAGHGMDYLLKGDPTFKAEKKLREYEFQLARKYKVKPGELKISSAQLTREEADRYAELVGAALNELELTDLQKSYRSGLPEITGSVPFRKDISHRADGVLSSNWPDRTTGPKKEFAPCISAYACSSEREFVAEWNMHIARKGLEFWRPLITPPGRPGHDPNQYDEKYWKTYAFFANNGFVTDENKEKMEQIRIRTIPEEELVNPYVEVSPYTEEGQ